VAPAHASLDDRSIVLNRELEGSGPSDESGRRTIAVVVVCHLAEMLEALQNEWVNGPSLSGTVDIAGAR
jgi:hypothetical protein